MEVAIGCVMVAPYTPRNGRRPLLMRLRKSLQAMRRGRSVILAAVLIGVVVGWLSAPGASRGDITFEAIHTLLLDSTANAGSEVRFAAVRATLGPVPQRVASRLGLDPELVKSNAFAQFRHEAGVLLITGRSTDRAQAEALANVTAEELIVELGGSSAPFRSLEPAVALPRERADIQGPTSRTSRAVFHGHIGQLLGVAAA